MNLLHFKYAVEIAKTKSISKAAENLFMGQPNLSRAIKELEESLGIIIFNRTPKGISITPEGEEFLRYAKRIIRQVDEVEEIYKNGRKPKTRFSACVPRATYLSHAFTEFAKHINDNSPADFFYKETNSMRTINSIINGDYNIGIIRYQDTFENYFLSMFAQKLLVAEIITDFSYVLVMSEDSPLADKEVITTEDLYDYVEISHADPYVPSLPLTDIKKAEISENVKKHIFVFERGSQFDLLERMPESFMWVSPLPQDVCDKYHLVQRKCADQQRTYRDVLIYRMDYTPTALDKKFIEAVNKAKDEYIDEIR
ncbi:MAG: LysR family transcriptional regulator [Clostridia bacterium]|nr:LysR family transcriptional regulator [Clostridia bacterium]MEE1024136.1 LysR family transcriptional regulator [Acutalibacteraceae bacterium]